MLRSILALASSICMCVFIAGCGGTAAPTVVPVTGEVLYQGKAVDGADVTFSPPTDDDKKARPAGARTDAQGKFTLKTQFDQKELAGALPGTYKVTITKKEGADQAKMMELMKAGKPVPQPKDILPKKYGSAATTDLTQTVKAGDKNEFKFPLVD